MRAAKVVIAKTTTLVVRFAKNIVPPSYVGPNIEEDKRKNSDRETKLMSRSPKVPTVKPITLDQGIIATTTNKKKTTLL